MFLGLPELLNVEVYALVMFAVAAIVTIGACLTDKSVGMLFFLPFLGFFSPEALDAGIVPMISGGVQPVADVFLTMMALRYGEKFLHISKLGPLFKAFKTPIWMIALWSVAMNFLWHLWGYISGHWGVSLYTITIFILIVVTVFAIFEFLVTNFTGLWWRVGCFRWLGVDFYAVFEAPVGVALSIVWVASLGLFDWEQGLLLGLLTALSYIVFAFIDYKIYNRRYGGEVI